MADEGELLAYTSAMYKGKAARRTGTSVKKKVKPMGTTTRAPLNEPASTAATNAPFSIVSGTKSAQSYLKILLYGKFGHGKTVLAAQAADIQRLRDVLFVNVEGGTHSIIGSGAVQHHEDIDFVPSEGSITDYETFVAVHKMLLAYCQARDDKDTTRISRMADKYGFDPKKRYRTVIIDTLSELNMVSLARAFGEDDDLLSLTDSDDTRRDYGRNRQAMLKAIRAFRNLPMNVIMTCGADWDKNENDRDKRPKYYPRITGQLSQDVQGFFDVVGFLYSPGKSGSEEDDESMKSPESRLYLQPGRFWDAKNRLAGRGIKFIDDPTMPKLISLLTGAKTAK